ncbi:MAG TPA: hypothetical protein VMV18_14270 [bacterium]|nr:hypothetical protein [bacterium]
MAYLRRLFTALSKGGPMCDGCLSDATKITPRQTVALLAMDMERAGNVLRKKTACPVCGKTRMVTGIPKGGPRKAPTEEAGFFAKLFGKD